MAGRDSLKTFSDFVEPDRRSRALLQGFFDWLQTPGGGGENPATAGALAHAADRYLRDFVVDILELPPEATDAGTCRMYLANWYAIHTLAPTHAEVDRIARALRLFHLYGAEKGFVERGPAEEAARLLADASFFHDRLESFWALTPEGIAAWRAVSDYRKPAGGRSF